MGLRRSARVGGGRDVVSLTPTQTVPPCATPGHGAWHQCGESTGGCGAILGGLGGGEGGGHQCGRATQWGPFMGGQCCREGGFRRAPRSRGHRRCQLSPGSCGWPARGHGDIPAAPRVPAVPAICAPPHPGPPCLFPPPRRIAGAAAANSSPRPHLGNIWVGGGCPLPWGLSGGRMLPGGGRGVPKAPGAGGMNEVVAWATAPEPGGLPRAAGSCAGGMGGAWGAGPPPAVPTLNAPVLPADPGARWQGRWPPRCLHRVGTGMGRGWWPSPCGGWDLRGWCVPPPTWVGLGSC